MLRKQLFTLILLVGMLFSQPVTHAAAADACNHVEFIADLSIPDGSVLAPGTTFVKTWRLKNIGQCTWNTNYSLIFSSGDQMGIQTTVGLPVDVLPGQMVDLSITLTAPASSGHYRSYWLLRADNQETFGMGETASNPFWVDIQVLDTAQVAFDFVARAPEAQWQSGVGKLAYPGIGGDNNGYARVVDRPRLENDALDIGPGLLMVPQNKYNGYIQGTFPEYTVQAGDRLQTLVNCEFGASNCNVIFRVDYLLPNGIAKKYKTWNEKTDGRFLRVDMDLSALAGQKVRFILMVLTNGWASDDRAVWGTPRIVHAAGVIPPTITVTPSNPLPLTPSLTPISASTSTPYSDCDRISFVADITIPDGTVFTPGAPIHKIWQLKNSGTCEWTIAYSAVFYNGDPLGAPAAINLPVSVAPGQSIDLMVDMVAPTTAGRYRSYWLLRNSNGALFGLGSPGTLKPFWVEINVIDPLNANTGYDFTARACDAQWRSGAGPLPCPGTDGSINGFVLKQDAPRLEDGSISSLPGLLTFPQFKYNGYIQGTYPIYTVQPGDRFQATVGCEYGAECYVTYHLDFASTSGWARTLWSWREMNQGRQNNIDVDLGPLVGYSGRFTLTLLSTGYASGDRALWVAPRIFRQGGVPPVDTVTPLSPTETSTLTPTMTATPSDWLTYTNASFGFEFKYPPQSQTTNEDFNSVSMKLPQVSPPGTNLTDKYLDMWVASGTCSQPPEYTVTMTPEPITLSLNGLTFQRWTGWDGAMSHYHDWDQYSLMHGNDCINFNFVLASVAQGVFDPTPPAFDKAAESAIYRQILSTFTWLPATPTPTLTPTDTTTPTATLTPTINPASLTGPYAVVSVAPGSLLNIYSSPGTGNLVVGSFTPNTTNIMRTGQFQQVDSVQWVQVLRSDGGTGWVDARYLTEYVTPAAFCSDARIQTIAGQLRQAMEQSDGGLFSSLISPAHGVNIRFWYSQPGLTFNRSQAAGLFTDLTEYNWGAGPGGIDDIIIFRDFIPFRVSWVLGAPNLQTACNQPNWVWDAPNPWPAEYGNIRFFTYNRPSQSGVQIPPSTWLIGFEYVQGQPYLFSMVFFSP